MIGTDLPALSIADLQSLLRRREVSSHEVINALRERINEVDGDLGAYLSLDVEAALKEAEHANVDLPLGGNPIDRKRVVEGKKGDLGGRRVNKKKKITRQFPNRVSLTIMPD